ncbi:SulP family inorganic anion transporter [bacterium CPR1]|nr:SulP family inorganic anion transporter [bacterium CPR1]
MQLLSSSAPRGPHPKDYLASLVVFLVALPLCLGIAIASGLPPAAGLITGIIGGLVVGFLAGSPLQVSGPAAGLAVIVWELVHRHGTGALALIILLAGLIQLLAGLLKLGRWFQAVSPSVIGGMLGGIGVLIFASQFHVMVDDKPRGSGLANLASIPEAISKGVFPMDGTSHHLAAMLGLLTLTVLVVWNRFHGLSRSVPAPLAAVVVATLAAVALGLDVRTVEVPANLTQSFVFPHWTLLTSQEIWLEALALAFIASAETLLCASAVDQMHSGPRTRYDRELMAQGVGNTLCGLVGGLPMTGVIVRSSANVLAGARTRWSAILHGVWMLALVVVFPGVLRLIPTAALAAILVYTGYKLVNPKNIKALARFGKSEVAIYFITLVSIVFTDLLHGVLIGMGCSLIKLLARSSYLEAELNRLGSNLYELRLTGSATFVTLPRLAEALDQIPDGATVHVYLDQLTTLDHACLQLMRSWDDRQRSLGGNLVVEWPELETRARLKRPVLQAAS